MLVFFELERLEPGWGAAGMAGKTLGMRHRPAEPLASRHIFLDTQVYRALGHKPAKGLMPLLPVRSTFGR
jgi:hypothetical protein